MDPVANMLAILKNAQAVLKPTASVSYSRMKYDILKILEAKGVVDKVEKKNKKIKKNVKTKPCLEITLKYEDNTPMVSGFKKISTPGKRIYISASDIRPVKQGYGIGIISTSKGLMTTKEARKQKIGGEYLLEIW